MRPTAVGPSGRRHARNGLISALRTGSIAGALAGLLAGLAVAGLAAGKAFAGKPARRSAERSRHRSFSHPSSTHAPSGVLRPFRSTAMGDLYRLVRAREITAVRLIGYRYRSLSVSALRHEVRHGVLALSTYGRALSVRRVAKAHGRKLRRSHGLLLTRSAYQGGAGPATSPAHTLCTPPYSPSSPWNTPISANATVNPNSGAYVSTIGANLDSDPTQYTFPVYYVNSKVPTGTVSISGVFANAISPATMSHGAGSALLPVPSGIQPSSGSDGEAIVWDLATGDEWGFWRLSGSAPNLSATNGYHYNTSWSGVPPGPGPRGAGIPYLAGLVRPCEITQGHIDHALAFGSPHPSSAHVYPATKSDGNGSGMPEGSRIQLDPGISDATIHSWGCNGACFITAKALQVYGAYLTDTAGHPKFYFEGENTAHWNGTVTRSTTSTIPYTALRVVS
jgi:hypothetical protein